MCVCVFFRDTFACSIIDMVLAHVHSKTVFPSFSYSYCVCVCVCVFFRDTFACSIIDMVLAHVHSKTVFPSLSYSYCVCVCVCVCVFVPLLRPAASSSAAAAAASPETEKAEASQDQSWMSYFGSVAQAPARYLPSQLTSVSRLLHCKIMYDSRIAP